MTFDADLRENEASKWNVDDEKKILKWIADVLSIDQQSILPCGSFADHFESGVLLCRLARLTDRNIIFKKT